MSFFLYEDKGLDSHFTPINQCNILSCIPLKIIHIELV